MTLSELSRLGRLHYALALLAALAGSGAVRAQADGGTNCTMGYPFQSSDPRTDVDFNESGVLRAFSPEGTVQAQPGLTIKVWYNDEHALTLGVRRVVVKTRTGTTTTDYPVSALSANPGSVADPQVGTTALDGDQAGTDTSACSGNPDLCDRPMFPALFITDISTDPNSTAGDWQAGGTPVPPHAVFGTWKAAVRTVDETHSPAVVTVTTDDDPAKNDWDLGSGDPAPAGLKDEGYGAEVRWNVDDLVAAGRMIMGHTYRLQLMVHDGDQNQTGGDAGENCVNVHPNCTDAASCDDRNPCTADSCDAGDCHYTPIAGCKLCATDADCDDQNACTTDSCDGGACRNTAIDGCTPCTTPADCDDQNACTTESCDAGVCHNTAIAGCKPCTAPADCDDQNACTTESCDAGVCHNTAIDGCKPCTTPADCDDQNACTTESCDAGVCHNTAIDGCKPCTTPADCDDQNACTTESCDAGVCHNTVIAGCKPCTTPADCDDQNACTTESCDAGVCHNTAIAGCKPCTTPADCDDQNACTTESCDAGVCHNTAIAGCKPCSTTADCDDQNACTTDFCGAGVCNNGTIPGCTPCTTSADCDDQDACTQDLCTAGACQHTPLANCPAVPVEICGDCIDNDGNGLTDFEDPACCAGQVQRFTMELKRGRIRGRGVTSRLRLRSILARAGMSDANPLKQDVFLQIRPEGGTDVLCARVPAKKFMHRHHAFKFWDHQHRVVSAKGIDDMRIKVRRDGSLRFRTTARHAQMTAPQSDRVEITVAFHDPEGVDANNQCSAVTKAFRTARHGALLVP